MAQRLFELLKQVFKLMADNKLKKDIDDTLLEKLLTLIQKCTLNFSQFSEIIDNKDSENSASDFIKDLIQRTEALYLIEKVLSSVTLKNESISMEVKSFVLRFIGVILVQQDEVIIPYEKLLPLFKDSNNGITAAHAPSIQDALLYCLSCLVKKIEGVMWFINQSLKDFVISSFNSSSYYIRKSAINFFVDFLSQWSAHLVSNKERTHEDVCLEVFIQNLISFVFNQVCLYQNSKEIVSAECCIVILKSILELKSTEVISQNHLSLIKNVSDCFMNLSEDKEFNVKLADLFLTIHSKLSVLCEINDVIKCLIFKENIELAFHVISSFACTEWMKPNYPEEVKIFFLPAYILLNLSPITLFECGSIFSINCEDIYAVISKKMEDKSQCKLIFKSSLAALQKVVPQMNSNLQRSLGMTMLKISKCSEEPYHKWLYPVLEDRLVHQSLIEFYSSLISDEVHSTLKYEKSDLVFQTVLEFLKKQTSDSNFLSQLISLMKDILKLHNENGFDIEIAEKSDLAQILCKVLLDNRESVVDSAIHLASQIINMTTWQSQVIRHEIHFIIWDTAIKGNLDGTIRSTALKVIIESCLQPWFLKEILSSKITAEIDIPTELYELTHDSDFFLQREALSCLFLWIKFKWDEIPSLCVQYLYDASVSAIKSLDLEMKLISLDVWMWLLTEKYRYPNVSTSFLNVEEYITHLATCGFGLSMILAIEDYDQAVQYKAGSILNKLKEMLISNGISCDSLHLKSPTPAEESMKCTAAENLLSPISREEKEKGIDVVMELSTTEQITNICRPLLVTDIKYQHTNEMKEIICEVSSFWTTLWSENAVSILKPVKATNDVLEYESLLKDIILARVMECNSIDDIPDCY